MFILKTGHQPGVYVPLRALFLVFIVHYMYLLTTHPPSCATNLFHKYTEVFIFDTSRSKK